MQTHNASDHSAPHSSCTRRAFLQTGTLAATAPLPFALQPHGQPAPPPANVRQRSVIFILNSGGPSQLDCFDPKPAAPAEIRGPFRAISTASPEFQLSELLPEHARIADLFSLVRTCTHQAPPVHEQGWQLLQTGHLAAPGQEWPHIGCLASEIGRNVHDSHSHILLPGRLCSTGSPFSDGQQPGLLGNAAAPTIASQQLRCSDKQTVQQTVWDLSQETIQTRERYGWSPFGQNCLRARRLVEAGTKFVTINTFPSLRHEPTWDIHGKKPFTTLTEMARHVTPMYDRAYSALLLDLQQRGLLEETLVCCLAEFGRTPRINRLGGRDHWTHCFTALFAGGGVQGGRVIGHSDAHAAYPAERPVSPAELLATIYHSLGIAPHSCFTGADGITRPLMEDAAQPLHELF